MRPQTLTRLVDMGVKPYAIATSVSLIIAQRLARKLCSNCKQPIDIPEEALRKEGFEEADIANGIRVYKAVGCGQCTDGYKGRVGIYQVMPVTETIGRIIMEGGGAIAHQRPGDQGRHLESAPLGSAEGQGWRDQPGRSQQRHHRIANARIDLWRYRQQRAKKETQFLWEGKDKRGNKVRGKSLAANEAALRADLRRQGVAATRVKTQGKPLFGGAARSPTRTSPYSAASWRP